MPSTTATRPATTVSCGRPRVQNVVPSSAGNRQRTSPSVALRPAISSQLASTITPRPRPVRNEPAGTHLAVPVTRLMTCSPVAGRAVTGCTTPVAGSPGACDTKPSTCQRTVPSAGSSIEATTPRPSCTFTSRPDGVGWISASVAVTSYVHRCVPPVRSRATTLMAAEVVPSPPLRTTR